MNKHSARRCFDSLFRTRKTAKIAFGLTISAVVLAILGCSHGTARPDGSVAAGRRIDLLLPKTIDILPFTRPASFDQDAIPDGIEVVLRPLDAFGDPVKVIGTFRFELYMFRKASADTRGHRLGFWQVDLTDEQAQKKHWDRFPPTYRFRLGWSPELKIERGKYVLEVTYLSPWNQRLSATHIIDAEVPRARMKQKTENRSGY